MPRPGKQPIHRRAFQSAPAIAGGRCTAAAWALVRLRRFNPRPPLLAGDAPAACSFDQPLSTFQSAPAIAGGRCDGCPGSPTRDHCFNPRPPLLAGDAGAWPRRPAAPAESFNPRPPLLAGDAVHVPAARHARVVSIRARHCWRAMHMGEIMAQLPHRVSIRARHCWRAMPCPCSISISRSRFQSAPAIAGGRCRLPHPAPRRQDVSIRARHCWRAMRRQSNIWSSINKFQSAPAIAGGRCRRGSTPARCRSGFNPRPPLLAGDAGTRPFDQREPDQFQSAPAIAGGRCMGGAKAQPRH